MFWEAVATVLTPCEGNSVLWGGVKWVTKGKTILFGLLRIREESLVILMLKEKFGCLVIFVKHRNLASICQGSEKSGLAILTCMTHSTSSLPEKSYES